MVMMDKLLEFGDAAAAAATAGTALVLPNQIDTSLTVPDLGNGEPIWFVCSVATAIVAAGAGTLEVQLVSDSTDTIATDTSVTYHLRSPSITTANNSTSNPAGKVLFAAPLPLTAATGTALGLGGERYLGARLLAASQNISSGNVDCYLTTDPAKYRAYANAI
jgi:hypothetical protein